MNNLLNVELQEVQQQLVVSSEYVNIDTVLPHEEILEDRLEGLLEYIHSLKPYIIVPSILLCSRTNVIIDGHHRYYALKKLNKREVPVTKINYQASQIITGFDKVLSKEEIINTALKGETYIPKSTEHHFIVGNQKYPLILLSKLMLVYDEK